MFIEALSAILRKLPLDILYFWVFLLVDEKYW